MEARSKISLISTILNIVYLILIILVFVLLALEMMGPLNEVANTAGDSIKNASNHDAIGGYEVLGGLALGALGMFGYIALFAIAVFGGIVAIMLLSTIIVGIVSHHGYKKGKATDFKVDAILKIVMDGILASAIVFSTAGDIIRLILVAIFPIIVVVLSVTCLFIPNKQGVIN